MSLLSFYDTQVTIVKGYKSKPKPLLIEFLVGSEKIYFT
jgi:hypothetical protein